MTLTTLVESVESIANLFGDAANCDYSILKANVPSVQDGNTDAKLYAEVWTDLPGRSASDYMVGGFWLLMPNNPSGDYRFGAFAQAENYYSRSETGIVKGSVTGTATYKGNAAGLHTSLDGGKMSIQSVC